MVIVDRLLPKSWVSWWIFTLCPPGLMFPVDPMSTQACLILPRTVASFTKEVNSRLAKRPLKTNRRLANRGLTSWAKEATEVYPSAYGGLQSTGSTLTSWGLQKRNPMPMLITMYLSYGERYITYNLSHVWQIPCRYQILINMMVATSKATISMWIWKPTQLENNHDMLSIFPLYIK